MLTGHAGDLFKHPMHSVLGIGVFNADGKFCSLKGAIITLTYCEGELWKYVEVVSVFGHRVTFELDSTGL